MIGALLTPRIERAVPPIGTFIDLEGERIHYIDRGSGPAIMMIHGLSGNLRNFTYGLVDVLTNEFRVIAVDRPGSGYSVGRRKIPTTLPAQAGTVARLIQALGLERPLVVGHSMGGAVSLALALDHPESVRALALIAPLTQQRSSAPAAFRGLEIRSPFIRALVAHTIATPIAMIRGKETVRAIFAPEPVPADFGVTGGGLLSIRPDTFYHASSDMAAAHDDMPALVARYPALRLPIGILFGTQDAILDYRVHGERFAQQVPQTQLTLVPDAGHMLPVTQPALTAAWIRERAAS
jgi:pimeloyl-ACP methyl ester carboxylesterase